MDKPWEIVDLRHQKNGKIKIVSGCTDIANVLTRDVDDPMRNALLLKAAPKLYAALERLYGRLLMSDRDGDAHITEEDGAMAEAALKKARGEE